MQSISKCFDDLNNSGNVLLIFNIVESLSIGVYSDILSKEVVKLYCGTYMIKLWNLNLSV